MRSRLAAGLPGVLLLSAASTLVMTAGPALGADDATKATPGERREEISFRKPPSGHSKTIWTSVSAATRRRAA